MLSTTVEQLYYLTRESNKLDVLGKLIDAADDFYGIIFCQTKALVMDLTEALNGRGYKTDCLHGDKNQSAREHTMQAFRNKRVRILVCTDVASRGIDVKDVTHVINYSIPRELDNYVHRIGRTARSGKSGFAMSLVTPANRSLIGRIEKMTNSRMKEGKIPSGKEIAKKKLGYILAPFKEQNAHGRAMELLSDEWKNEIGSMSKEEIVGRFLAMKFPDLFKENALNESRPPREDRETRREGRGNDRGQRRPFRNDDRGERRPFRREDRRDDRPRAVVHHVEPRTRPAAPAHKAAAAVSAAPAKVGSKPKKKFEEPRKYFGASAKGKHAKK